MPPPIAQQEASLHLGLDRRATAWVPGAPTLDTGWVQARYLVGLGEERRQGWAEKGTELQGTHDEASDHPPGSSGSGLVSGWSQLGVRGHSPSSRLPSYEMRLSRHTHTDRCHLRRSSSLWPGSIPGDGLKQEFPAAKLQH